MPREIYRATESDQAVNPEDPHFWDDPAYGAMVHGRRLGEFSQATIQDAMTMAGHRCESCGSPKNLHAHHLLPLGIAQRLFSHIPPLFLSHFANCQILCASCHHKEHSRPRGVEEYARFADALILAVQSHAEIILATHRRRYKGMPNSRSGCEFPPQVRTEAFNRAGR